MSWTVELQTKVHIKVPTTALTLKTSWTQFHIYSFLALCLNRILNVKVIVAAFKQEKALVRAFSLVTNLRCGPSFEAVLDSAVMGSTSVTRQHSLDSDSDADTEGAWRWGRGRGSPVEAVNTLTTGRVPGRLYATCRSGPMQSLSLDRLECPAPCHAPGPPLEEDSLVTKSLLDMTRIRLKDDGDFGGDFGGESRDSIQIPEPELTQLSATILGNYPSICALFLCYNKRSAICSGVSKDGS